MSVNFKHINDFISKNCKGDDYTLAISEIDSKQTRFAQNRITQNISGIKLHINLEVGLDKKTGSASVNQVDDESLRYLIDQAESIVYANEEDPEYVASMTAEKLPEINNSSQKTEQLDSNEILKDIQICVENAKKKNAAVSGICGKTIKRRFISTKNGFNGEDKLSDYNLSMTMTGGGAETKIIRSVKDYSDFNIEDVITQINSQFTDLKIPTQSEKGKYNVILRPTAVYQLFLYMLYYFLDRQDSDTGITPFKDSIDQKVFGESFSFSSHINHPSLSTSLFDDSGTIAREIKWIDNGVLKNLITSRSYGKMISSKPSFVPNIRIHGGNMDETQMMKAAGRGLVINNFWYIRNVDMKKGELTGLTRDGVFYFENGEKKGAVTNLRFNEIPHEVTNRILGIGKEVQLLSNVIVPTLLVKDFNFVDVTTF